MKVISTAGKKFLLALFFCFLVFNNMNFAFAEEGAPSASKYAPSLLPGAGSGGGGGSGTTMPDLSTGTFSHSISIEVPAGRKGVLATSL